MYPELPNTPELVNVPSATYIMIRGFGPWDDPKGLFARSSKVLRNVHKELVECCKDFDAEFKQTPLEAFWWQQGAREIDLDDKDAFIWAVAMQVGNVSNEDVCTACRAVSARKDLDCGVVFLTTMVEGPCAQIRHAGTYDHEKTTAALLKEFITGEGLSINSFGFSPLHEIYLPHKEPDRRGQWDTVLRWPVYRKARALR